MVMNRRLIKETRAIVKVGIVMLLMTIMPSSVNSKTEPICWQKMFDCQTKAIIVDPFASFGLCCKEIKEQIVDLPCFCSAEEFVVNKSLKDCRLGSTFDKLCKDVSTSEVGKPPLPPVGMVESGATKIGILLGLVIASASLFAWTMKLT